MLDLWSPIEWLLKGLDSLFNMLDGIVIMGFNGTTFTLMDLLGALWIFSIFISIFWKGAKG